jgi:toxin ParE1/3/4
MQAEAYLRQIQTALQALAAAPEIAKPCDAVRLGYRRYPTGAHVILFRMAPEGIDVVRILHGRMDFSRHL